MGFRKRDARLLAAKSTKALGFRQPFGPRFSEKASERIKLQRTIGKVSEEGSSKKRKL